VAISIQVLVIASDPDIVSPTNLALAINEECTLCVTLASAYQFALGGQERLQLTGQGRLELQRIHQELLRLRTQELPADEIQTRTDALMDELRDVLSRELVVVGSGEETAAAEAPEGQDGQAEQDSSKPPEGAPEPPPPTDTAPTDTTPTDTTPTETTPAPKPPSSDSTQPSSP
jgi:hypothetical protein